MTRARIPKRVREEAPESEATIAANSYMAHFKGWTAGAAIRAMDPAIAEHPKAYLRDAYNAGYAQGHGARLFAMAEAAKRYDHTRSVLRLANGDAP